MIHRRRLTASALPALAAVLAGCGGATPASPPPAPAWTDDGYVVAGPYVLSYQAQSLQSIDPAVAQRYGLERVPQRGLLTLVVSRQPGALPVAANLTAAVQTLTGERRAAPLRRVEDTGAVSYLAEFPIQGREWLVFSVVAEVPEGPRLEAKFRREFFVD